MTKSHLKHQDRIIALQVKNKISFDFSLNRSFPFISKESQTHMAHPKKFSTCIGIQGNLAHWRPHMARRRITLQSRLFGNVGRGGSSSVTSPLRLFEDITEINQENVFISQTQRLRNPSMLKPLITHILLALHL